MTPTKLLLPIVRDASFKLELVSQVKNYVYDPAVHNTAADLQRTHAQNLVHHGFVYAYIDFATVYNSAELIISKAYSGSGTNPPIMILKTGAATATGLTLTNKSVQIEILPEDTSDINFDTAVYKLRLKINLTNEVDILVYGDVTVSGEK